MEEQRRMHSEEIVSVRRELCDILEQQTVKIKNLQDELEQCKAVHAREIDAERKSQYEKFAQVVASLEDHIYQQSKGFAEQERLMKDLRTRHSEETDSMLASHKQTVENLQVQLELANASAARVTDQMSKNLEDTVIDYEETLNQLQVLLSCRLFNF